MEPHTITFAINPKTMTTPDAPFLFPSSIQFMPLPPGANSKPNVIPGGKNGMNTIIASNAMSYLPAMIDASGNAKTFPPNGNLTLTGNEQYVNSGWILPKGGEQIFPGSSNTFTVTFPKAGTYSYTCTLHPWMTGKVIVK
jgi:plastocyanin